MNRFMSRASSVALAIALFAQGPLALAAESLTEASNNFAASMLQNISAQKSSENIAISSTSLLNAFALVAAGAGKADQKTILESLGYKGVKVEDLLADLKRFEASLTKEADYSISSENAFYSNVKLAPAYKAAIEGALNAQNGLIQFDQPGASKEINAWAEKSTKGMIKEIVKDDEINKLAFLALNATTFEAKWATAKFDSAYRPSDFTGEDGNVAGKVDLMTSDPEIKIAQKEYEKFTAYDVPYALDSNGKPRGSLVVILPKMLNQKAVEESMWADEKVKPELVPLQEAVAELNGQNIAQISADMDSLRAAKKVRSILLHMPKFKTETEIGNELKQMVEDLGAGSIFARIDLGAMTNIPEWKTSKIKLIKQKAVIDVAEEGTKAAAVSAIGGFPESCPPPSVFLNRPFAYLIKDAVTGRVLFAGTFVKGNK